MESRDKRTQKLMGRKRKAVGDPRSSRNSDPSLPYVPIRVSQSKYSPRVNSAKIERPYGTRTIQRWCIFVDGHLHCRRKRKAAMKLARAHSIEHNPTLVNLGNV